MNDREKIKAFLVEMGIGFEEKDGEILCREGMDKVHGYGHFFFCFEFDKDGSFTSVGVWE